MQYIRSKSGWGWAFTPNSYKIFWVYAHVPLLCTESMHLQSSLQRPLRYVSTAASVDLLAESWYCTNCGGGPTLVQITPLQGFGAAICCGRLLRDGLILRTLRCYYLLKYMLSTGLMVHDFDLYAYVCGFQSGCCSLPCLAIV